MKSIRTQTAIVVAIATLGFTGLATAEVASPVQSRIYLEAQDWTGGGAPDSAFTKASVLKSRSFDTVANDTIGGPTASQGTKVVRTLSWDNATAWTAREGGPTAVPVSQISGTKRAAN